MRGILLQTLIIAVFAAACRVAAGATVLFEEDFDAIPLDAPIDEDFLTPLFPEAFSHQPPPGWLRNASDVPGVGDPFVGVTEWEGWSFADQEFWIAAADQSPFGGTAGGREEFSLGKGTIAVADPDQWNDLGDPANEFGFYNTLLRTPVIDLEPVSPNEDRLILQFDSSFRPACCQFGQGFDPGGDNLTATITAVLPGGGRLEVLRWESAPFIDANGDPTSDPFDPTGQPHEQNVFFKGDEDLRGRVSFAERNDFNERVFVDLTDLLGLADGNAAAAALAASGSASGAATGGFELEFGVEDGGGDGYWAFDNVEVTSASTVLGDMDLSGSLDEFDIDDFAQGMLDTTAYRFDHYGEYPVTRGSLDSTFNFDDVAWFVGLFPSPATASALLTEALSPVPEPSSSVLITAALGSFASRRSRSR